MWRCCDCTIDHIKNFIIRTFNSINDSVFLGILCLIGAVFLFATAIWSPEDWWIPAPVGAVFLGFSVYGFWDKLCMVYEYFNNPDNFMALNYYFCMGCFMTGTVLFGVSAVFEILYLINIGLAFLVFGFKFLYNYNRLKKT